MGAILLSASGPSEDLVSDVRGVGGCADSTRVLDHLGERELLTLVYRQMRVFAGPHADLDDLVQTAMIQVLRARFEGRSKISTFTHAICYRVWLKHLRFRFRLRARFLPAQEGVEAEAAPLFASGCHLEDRERYLRLYGALAQLSEKRRAILTLHELSELPVAEIALIVDASEATVRSRLRDARKQLRQLLADDPYFADARYFTDRRAGQVATTSQDESPPSIASGDLEP